MQLPVQPKHLAELKYYSVHFFCFDAQPHSTNVGFNLNFDRLSHFTAAASNRSRWYNFFCWKQSIETFFFFLPFHQVFFSLAPTFAWSSFNRATNYIFEGGQICFGVNFGLIQNYRRFNYHNFQELGLAAVPVAFPKPFSLLSQKSLVNS